MSSLRDIPVRVSVGPGDVIILLDSFFSSSTTDLSGAESGVVSTLGSLLVNYSTRSFKSDLF